MDRQILCLGRALTMVVLALAFQPAVVRSQASAPLGTFPPAAQAALQRIVDQHLSDLGAPGAAVGVWVPGRGSWVHAQGTADVATNAPFAVDDSFRIASITKTFVATVILQLVDEGALRLDDHLEQYVRGIPNGDRITIRQVLGMTAGIFNYTEDATFLADYAANPLMPFSPEDVLAIVRRHPPDFVPGERFHYSDSNYTLLGLIVEQLTGQTPGDAIDARIIQPLRLSGTSFATSPAMPEPYAHGYDTAPNAAGLQDVTQSNPAVAWTAGAMVSTLDDLRLWVRALATGALLSPAVQRERLQGVTIPTADGVEARYGLGLFSIGGFIGHNGGIPGYSSIAVYLPEANATLVALVNKSGLEGGEADAILWDIAKLLFPERFPNN
jgi:D-alanyl-D-alanine carboxypeptidase